MSRSRKSRKDDDDDDGFRCRGLFFFGEADFCYPSPGAQSLAFHPFDAAPDRNWGAPSRVRGRKSVFLFSLPVKKRLEVREEEPRT